MDQFRTTTLEHPSSDPPSADVVDAWSDEPNLDLLRTMAVLIVVVCHVVAIFDFRPDWWLYFQALGIFGVLLFFVHTSLVLMISLSKAARSAPESKARLWTAFIIRRVFRIYPLSVTVVLLTYFVLVPLAGADAAAAGAGIVGTVHARDLWANLFLLQDLTRSASILAPLWSLPAEVQMYLVLPFLFSLVERGGVRAIARVVWPLSVVVAIVTWKLDLRFTVARYAPCFVAGVGCFGLLRRSRPLPFAIFPPAVFGLLLAYMATYHRIGLQAGLGIIATFAIGGMIPLFARMRSPALRSTSKNVAKYSYGVYLFHGPCIWIAFGKFSRFGLVGSSICLVALLAAISVLAYHLIENPLIRVGRQLAARLLGAPAATPSVVSAT